MNQNQRIFFKICPPASHWRLREFNFIQFLALLINIIRLLFSNERFYWVLTLKFKVSVSHQFKTMCFLKINWTNSPVLPQFEEMTSQDENKPGQSWTVLDIERDVTYALPIFLGVGITNTPAMNKYDNTQRNIIFHISMCILFCITRGNYPSVYLLPQLWGS